MNFWTFRKKKQQQSRFFFGVTIYYQIAPLSRISWLTCGAGQVCWHVEIRGEKLRCCFAAHLALDKQGHRHQLRRLSLGDLLKPNSQAKRKDARGSATAGSHTKQELIPCFFYFGVYLGGYIGKLEPAPVRLGMVAIRTPMFFVSSWKSWPVACPAGIQDEGGQTPLSPLLFLLWRIFFPTAAPSERLYLKV